MATLDKLTKRIHDKIADGAPASDLHNVVNGVFTELRQMIGQQAIDIWENAESEAEKRHAAVVDAITTKVDDERRYATGMQQPIRADTLADVMDWITDAIKESAPR